MPLRGYFTFTSLVTTSLNYMFTSVIHTCNTSITKPLMVCTIKKVNKQGFAKVSSAKHLHYTVCIYTCIYYIVGFFEVLKFREWLIFSFFTILFSNDSAKSSGTAMGLPYICFFERLNFMNDQYPQNSRNLCTLKKINYMVCICSYELHKNAPNKNISEQSLK